MKTNQTNLLSNSLESTINSVMNLLAADAPGGTTVVRESVPKGKSCKGILKVVPPTVGEKVNQKVSVIYAFYASTYRPSSLGSVAIYSDNPSFYLAKIRRSKTLFGFRVVDVKLENGRRPFIDVTLAA